MKPLKGVVYDWRVTWRDGHEITVRAEDQEQAERIATRKRYATEPTLANLRTLNNTTIISVTVA